jgi:hypothetical protein
MESNQQASIEQDCSKLCTAFAYHVDHCEFEALVELFTPDGVFVRNGHSLEGQRAIRAAYAQRPPATTVHFITNFHVLELTATRVRASSYGLVLHATSVSKEVLPFDPMGAMRTLEFIDEFQLTPAGWRFSSRDARPVLQSLNWPGKA